MCFSIYVILTMDYRSDYKQLYPLLTDLGYSDVFFCSYGLHTYFIDRQCSALWDCCIYGIEGDRCCFRVWRLICGHLKLIRMVSGCVGKWHNHTYDRNGSSNMEISSQSQQHMASVANGRRRNNTFNNILENICVITVLSYGQALIMSSCYVTHLRCDSYLGYTTAELEPKKIFML